MKALKIIGTLAAIGGVYFLFSSDDEEKKEEKKQENTTPNTNISPIEQLPANIAASKINQADMQPTNPIDQLPAKTSSFVMTPINDEFFTSITKELPSDQEAQSPNTPTTRPMNLVDQLPAEPGSFVMTPINDEFIFDISKKIPEELPIAKGDAEKFRFNAIELKKGGVVPIVIYSLTEIPYTQSDLAIFFPETGEQLNFFDFLPEQAKRLNQKELSVSISVSIPRAPGTVWFAIDIFVQTLKSDYGIEAIRV